MPARAWPKRPQRSARGSPSPCRARPTSSSSAMTRPRVCLARPAKGLEELGGRARWIDFSLFAKAAVLLYDGPFVAERTAAIGKFIEAHEAETDPTVRGIVLGGRARNAVETFEALYRLEALKRRAMTLFADIDVLVVPTAPTIYRVDEIAAEPVKLNSRLGTYTNFMNLLDMAGIAVPAGIRASGRAAGLPFGVTLSAPAFSEGKLGVLASAFERAQGLAPGGPVPPAAPDEGFIELAVIGAHMSGLPLNHELTSRGAMFVERTKTAPVYRFYALAGGPPFRPGLVRVPEGGSSIELEVWRVPRSAFGGFMAGVPQPLCIGTLDLVSGAPRQGLPLRGKRARRCGGNHLLWRLAGLHGLQSGAGSGLSGA